MTLFGVQIRWPWPTRLARAEKRLDVALCKHAEACESTRKAAQELRVAAEVNKSAWDNTAVVFKKWIDEDTKVNLRQTPSHGTPKPGTTSLGT